MTYVTTAAHLECIHAQSESAMESIDGAQPFIGRDDLAKHAVLRLSLDEAPNIVQQTYWKLSFSSLSM